MTKANIELNKLELEILKEITNGKNEYMYAENDKTDGEPTALFHLNTFGYITAKTHSEDDKVGYVEIELTDKGKETLNSENS